MSRKTLVFHFFHFPAFLLFVLFLPVQAQTSPDDLLAKVQQQGHVMVIVELDLGAEFQAEGSLTAVAVNRQRSHIAQTTDSLRAELAGTGSTVNRRYQTVPAVALTVDEAGLERLYRSASVKSVQEDRLAAPSLEDSIELINVPFVWAKNYRGNNQAVAILDTGIDRSHPFFKVAGNSSRIVAEACFSNAGGQAGRISLCPNGQNSQIGAGSAEARIAACNSGSLCGHGTHVAGIAAGYTSGALKGVAPNADIIAIQVFTRFNNPDDCSNGNAPCVLSYTSDQIAALDHVNSSLKHNHNVAAANMSLAGGQHFSDCDSQEPQRKAAIDNLRSSGIATVIAAGNNGFTDSISAPACISSAIAVSSTTKTDQVSGFSNLSDQTAVFAPGSGIYASVPGGDYGVKNGTSMAAPHVAGIWALLKQARPSASVNQILNALTSTGKPLTDQRADGNITKPRVRPDAAVTKLTNGTFYNVNPSVAGSGGTISPATSQSVPSGSRETFVLRPDSGHYIDRVTGSCPGTLEGNRYEAGPVAASCTVIARFKAVPPAAPVLYDDTGNSSGYGIPAHANLIHPEFDVQAADDFIVPDGKIWDVKEVYAYGWYGADSTQAPSDDVNVFFYADNNGKPGTEMKAFHNLVPYDSNGALTIHLPQTLTLEQGRYWLSIQPRRDSQRDGNWFWLTNKVLKGSYAHWRNPQGGFETDCTDWERVIDCYQSSDLKGLFLQVRGQEYEPVPTWTVTPSADAGGIISPSDPRTVNEGSTVTFTLKPHNGFMINAVGGSCGGSMLDGKRYRTAPVTKNCTVSASFRTDPEIIFKDEFELQ